MKNGHLDACRALVTGNDGDCHCASEERRYLRLARLSFGLFVFEFVAGWLVNSLALMSDAFHVLFDGSESIISAIVSRLARKGTNEKKVRHIGGLISASLLLVIAGAIIREGWERFIEPQEVAWLVIVAAAMGLFVNLWQHRIHEEAPHEHRNITHFWQSRHIWYDAAGSAAVVVGGIVMAFTGWYRLDGLLSMALGLWIATLTLRRILGKSRGHR